MFVCESRYSVRKKSFKKIKVMFNDSILFLDFELAPANKI